SQVISLHTPLTDVTRGMIGAEQLALMRGDAILVNTSRGGVVETEALVEALGSGGIRGAAPVASRRTALAHRRRRRCQQGVAVRRRDERDRPDPGRRRVAGWLVRRPGRSLRTGSANRNRPRRSRAH